MIEYYSLVLIQYYNELLHKKEEVRKVGQYVRLIEEELRSRVDNFGNLEAAKNRLTAEKIIKDSELKICVDKYNQCFDNLFDELIREDWYTVRYLFHVRRVGTEIEIYSYVLGSYEQCKTNVEDWKMIDIRYQKYI